MKVYELIQKLAEFDADKKVRIGAKVPYSTFKIAVEIDVDGYNGGIYYRYDTDEVIIESEVVA